LITLKIRSRQYFVELAIKKYLILKKIKYISALHLKVLLDEPTWPNASSTKYYLQWSNIKFYIKNLFLCLIYL